MRWLHPSHRKESLLILLLLLLCGAMVLPMLPVWQGAIRVLAILALFHFIGLSSRPHQGLAIILTSSLLTSVVYWIQSLAAAPTSHVIASLTDVYGQPLGILPDAILLAADVICLTGLFSILLRQETRTRLSVLFCGGLLAFWGSGLATVLAHSIAPDTTQESLAQMLTGLSGWTVWLYWAALTLLLVRNEKQLLLALDSLGIAGIIVGTIIALQWLLGDFSYLINGYDAGSEFFSRVRGTDYYHAPATLVVVIGSLAVFAKQAHTGRTSWLFLALVLVSIVALNNTRAISLALLSGLGIALISAISLRRWAPALGLAIAFSLTLTNVFYLKPAYQPAPAITEQATTQQLAGANQPRALLAKEGLHLTRTMPLIGHGIGTFNLPLEGDEFNGLLSTDSTHTLYLDIALMSGVLALLGFSLITTASALGGLITASRRTTTPKLRFVATYVLGLLSAFAIAWLFLPQERNELIAVFMLVAALAVRSSSLISDRDVALLRPPAIGYVLLALAAGGWAVATSPRYVFPAIELIGKHGGEIVEQKQHVSVADPVTAALTRQLLKLRGGQGTQVTTLSDNPQVLKNEQHWILWYPATAKRYPKLMQAQQAWRHVYRDAALGFTPPPNAWVMPSAQPSASFVFLGVRAHELPLEALSQSHYPLLTYPNAAAYGQIRLGEGLVNSSRNVSDYNFGSVVYWHNGAQEHADIQFSALPNNTGSLRMYQITAMPHRSKDRAERYSWALEGSMDEQRWHTLDRKAAQRLSIDGKTPSTYLLASDSTYRYFRFRFTTVDQQSQRISGIAEIALFFSPKTQSIAP